MSRIGKLPVAVPSNVEVKIDGQDLLIMKESDIMGVVAL